MKSAMKTPNGLKTVMTLVGPEEASNKVLQAELTAIIPGAQAAKVSSVTIEP